MKSITNIKAFARQEGLSRQLVEHRIKSDYKFGYLNGVRIMYNPKSIFVVKGIII